MMILESEKSETVDRDLRVGERLAAPSSQCKGFSWKLARCRFSF